MAQRRGRGRRQHQPAGLTPTTSSSPAAAAPRRARARLAAAAPAARPAAAAAPPGGSRVASVAGVAGGCWACWPLLLAAPAQRPARPRPSQTIDVQRTSRARAPRHAGRARRRRWTGTWAGTWACRCNYAKQSAVLPRPAQDDFVYSMVANQLTVDLMGAISLVRPVRAGRGAAHHLAVLGVLRLRRAGLPERREGDGPGRPAPGAQGAPADRAGSTWAWRCPCTCPPRAARASCGGAASPSVPQLLGEWTQRRGCACWPTWASTSSSKQQLRNLDVGNELTYGLGARGALHVGKHRLAAEPRWWARWAWASGHRGASAGAARGGEVPLLGRAGRAPGRWPGPHAGLRHAGLPRVRGRHLDRRPASAPGSRSPRAA